MPIEDDTRLERLGKEHENLCQALTGCTLSAHGSEVVIRTRPYNHRNRANRT
jgi:hypothetical protein